MKRGQYFAKILDLVYMLEDKIVGIIESQGMKELYYDVELPLAEVLASMEYYGFKIDVEILKELGSEI